LQFFFILLAFVFLLLPAFLGAPPLLTFLFLSFLLEALFSFFFFAALVPSCRIVSLSLRAIAVVIARVVSIPRVASLSISPALSE